MKTSLRPTGTAGPAQVRARHRAMVLQRLFHGGPASRAELARVTGLTPVTVSDLVQDLLVAGLVAETGPERRPGVGKRGTLLALRTVDHQVVAVDLADDARLHGAVLDLAGTVLARAEEPWAGCTGEAGTELVVRLARRLAAAATRPLLGVGVGSPGVVADDGTVVLATNRGWAQVPLAARLRAALGVPVHVANDADAACLGELGYGGAGDDGLLVVGVRAGVGAGLVVQGVPVRGAGRAAGEIGHVTAVDARDEPAPHGPGPAVPCVCGRTGCLETVLRVPALRALAAGPDPARALAAVGRRLGEVLAPVAGVLDLAEIVLAGPVDLLDGPLVDAARETLLLRTARLVGPGPQLRVSALGDDGALRGAAALVLAGELGVA